MNKVFLIGNGFDLAHGLRTSYIDFVIWYFNKEFEKLFKFRNTQLDNDLIKLEYPFHHREKLKFNNIEQLKIIFKEHIKITYKSNFFKNIVDNMIN